MICCVIAMLLGYDLFVLCNCRVTRILFVVLCNYVSRI